MPEMLPEAEDDEGGAAQEVERHDDVGYARLLPDDKYDIDIDRDFKGFVTDDGALRSVRKPANWRRAIHLASEVLLSEMRTLLEIHYDDVHVTEWRRKHDESVKKMPSRKSQWTVFKSVVNAHQRRPNMRVELPSAIQQILLDFLLSLIHFHLDHIVLLNDLHHRCKKLNYQVLYSNHVLLRKYFHPMI